MMDESLTDSPDNPDAVEASASPMAFAIWKFRVRAGAVLIVVSALATEWRIIISGYATAISPH